MVRARSFGLAIALACVCYGGSVVAQLFTLAGWKRSGSRLRTGRIGRKAVIQDRGVALRTLGLQESFGSPPTEEELKKAYRQAVRTAHPDTPGGSAQKLLKVKEAYDYLVNAPSVTTWDEGRPMNERRASTTYTSPGRKWPRYPQPQQQRPKTWEGRREVIVGGVVLGTLVSIGIASQVVNTANRDEYLANRANVGDDVEGLGGTNRDKIPPLVARGEYKLGEVYRQFADEAMAIRRPILLMGEALPGGAQRQGSGTQERALGIATCLLSVLAATKSDGSRRFETVTAVLSQTDMLAVARLLRINEDTANIREPQRPYLFYGGGPVLRFQRDEPEQELLMVPTQQTYVASSDFDPLAAKTLREMNSPGIFVYDLTREQWAAQSGEFQRPEILSEVETEQLLQKPEPAEPATADPATAEPATAAAK